MNSQIKKSYISPELITHGNVEKITENGGCVEPTDTPNGAPNQAFPLSGSCAVS